MLGRSDKVDDQERIRWMCYLALPDNLRLLIEQEDQEALNGILADLDRMNESRLSSIVKIAIELKSKDLLRQIELYEYSTRNRGFFS